MGRNLAGIVAALSAIIPCGLPYNRSGPPLSTRNHGAPEDQTTHPPTRPRPHQRVRTADWAVGQPHLQLYTVPYFYKRKISLYGDFRHHLECHLSEQKHWVWITFSCPRNTAPIPSREQQVKVFGKKMTFASLANGGILPGASSDGEC